MNFTRRKTPGILVWSAAILLLLPGAIYATHFEISRLASQLNTVSSQLAWDLRGTGAYSSLRHRADRLSKEAADLVDAVSRNRSSSYVRSRFNDVSRQYTSLEEAFLRVNRNNYNPYLFQEVEKISYLYSSLRAEIYYGAWQQPPNVYYRAPPVVVKRYERLPPVYIEPGYQNQGTYRDQQRRNNNRIDYGRKQVQRLPGYDHRSKVLERQHRLDNRRPHISVERRGRQTETRRRNHYE